MSCKTAVLGATGLVGREIVNLLEEREFPVSDLYLYASENSAGEKMSFFGEDITIKALKPDNVENCDIYLSSMPGEVSQQIIPEIQEKNSGVIIDNSSSFRMDRDVPLVVPEVNGELLDENEDLIANPNCSTIQLVMVLKPLLDEFGLKRVLVSTYQSASGSGAEAVSALKKESRARLQNGDCKAEYYDNPIAFNLLPAIDYFHEDGFSNEEIKMRRESRKILAEEDIEINCTCVRVPVEYGHAESVYLELEEKTQAEMVSDLLDQAVGVKVLDEPEAGVYPQPLDTEKTDDVLVGRIRNDRDRSRGIHLYIAANNIRKGAALNAVQIAEKINSGK